MMNYKPLIFYCVLFISAWVSMYFIFTHKPDIPINSVWLYEYNTENPFEVENIHRQIKVVLNVKNDYVKYINYDPDYGISVESCRIRWFLSNSKMIK